MAVSTRGLGALGLTAALLSGCGGGPAPAVGAERASEAGAAPVGVEDRERDIEVRAVRAIARSAVPGAVPSGDADDDLVACRILVASSRLGEARAAYAALARVHPGDPVVQIAVARFQLEDGRPGAAVAALDALASRGVHHGELGRLRGTVHLQAGDAALGESLLRAELAEGGEFAAAAFALCDHFVARESFGEALAVVAAARLRDASRADLRVLEARLLRDVWQLDQAAGRLDDLLAERPELAAARVELVDVERARGRRDDARVLLDAIRAQDPWAQANRQRLQSLRDDLEGDRPLVTPRDMLAMVRGGDTIGLRVRALEALLGVPATRSRAIEVAFVQDEPVLRAMAVRAIPADEAALAEALGIASEDVDPRVRAAAVRRAADLPDVRQAVELARRCLEVEDDPYAFRAAHEALAARLGPQVDLPPGAERDPLIRQQIRQAWREQCPE